MSVAGVIQINNGNLVISANPHPQVKASGDTGLMTVDEAFSG